MEKLYGCENVIFRTRQAAEDYAKCVYEKYNAFAQIREWYIDKAEREITPLEKKKHKMKCVYEKYNAFAKIREWYIDKAEREMTPLEKKKHKMKQRLEKIQEDFE